MTELQSNQFPQTVSTTIMEFLMERCDSVQSRKSYLNDLTQFNSFLVENSISFESSNRLSVQLYLEKLRARNLAPATIAKKLSVIKSLYQKLATENHYPILEYERIKGLRAPKVSRDGRTPGLSSSEVSAMLSIPDRSSKAGVRDYALLLVLFYSGARVSAITKLRVKDFTEEYHSPILQLHEKGNRRIKVHLNEQASNAISEWIRNAELSDDSILFPPFYKRSRTELVDKPMHPSSLWYLIKRIAKRAGIETERFNERGICVHSTRVTAITHAFKGGAKLEEVQEMVGHKDPSNTLRYRRKQEDDIKKAVMSIQY